MSETRTKARTLLAAATPGPFSVYPLTRAGRGFGVGRETPSGHDEGICEDPHMLAGDAELFAAAPGLLVTLCTEGDAAAAANVQLTAIIRQLQREKTVLEVSLADARQQYAATTTEQLVLLSAYAMNYGTVRVTEEFALRHPIKVDTRCHDGVYEVIGGDLPNDFPSRLGVLVMLAVRRVTATASEDDTYALLQALGCPAICAADPVKLGTAATELADLVGTLMSSRVFSSVMSRDTRAEELTRCCRMLIPLLDEPVRREVIRRMGGRLEGPTRVQTHDRDCLCQRCLDEAGRGR